MGNRRRLHQVKLNDVGLVDHLVDPINAIALCACISHGGFHFGTYLFGVGSSCAENDIIALVHRLDCLHKVDNALLSGDTADKEDEGLVVWDLELIQCWSGIDWLVFFRVDSVVDNVNLFGRDVKVF